jgi:hypothetical protein
MNMAIKWTARIGLCVPATKWESVFGANSPIRAALYRIAECLMA